MGEVGVLADADSVESDNGGGSRLVALVLMSVIAAVGLGWGAIKVVDALEPTGDCGSYGYGGGYGGYGCDTPFGITVAPSTDLVDRQTVTLTGTGFLPNTSFGAAQCDPSQLPTGGIAACDLSTSRLSTTDDNGNVVLDLNVRRIIIVNGGELDCALNPCVIGAATLENGSTPIEGTSVPISFDPAVPAVPRLHVALTVDDVTASAISGTVTCNRAADAFIDASVQQSKGGHQADAYGYSNQPLACGTTATAWTIPLQNGSGVLSGGPATYSAFASAYDSFESAQAEVTGTTSLAGGHQSVVPVEQPGETVRVEILGTTGSGSDLAVDLLVTCDRAVPEAYTFVEVVQRAGLDRVTGYGSADFGPCDGAEQVSVPITASHGTLAGGPAEVRAYVAVFDPAPPNDGFYDSATAVAGTRLKGAVRPEPGVVEPNPTSRITITAISATSLTGTVMCEEPAEVDLWAVVQQSKGRTTNDAYGYNLIDCDGPTAFTIPLVDGGLSGGSASAFVSASAFREVGEDYQFLWDDYQAAALRITR